MTKEELMTAYKKNAEEFIETAKAVIQYRHSHKRLFEAAKRDLEHNQAKGKIIAAKLLPLLD
jgi:hypothetical protein